MVRSRGWMVLLCIVLVLSACVAAVADDAAVPADELLPTETLRVPPMVIATFTPVAEVGVLSPTEVGALAEAGAPVQPDVALAPAAPAPTPVPVRDVAPVEVLPFVQYTVEAGDTLLGLALKYGIPMAVIQLQNDLGSSTIVQVGRALEIPPAVGWEGASPFWVVYEVQAGDVLSAIAATYGFDTMTLEGVNGLADADLLSVGQALILPLEAPADVVVETNRASAAAVVLPTVTPVPPEEPSATAAPDQPAPAPAAPPPLPADVAAMPAEIFRLINEQRAAYGLAPLAWNATLARAAQLHADDCYARGWCGHTGSDGSTMKERIIRQGYDPVRWSECWAWYGTPEMAVAMWMDEVPPNDPHRRTILSTWLTEVGVGVVPGNGNGYYFIADFGMPR